MLTLNHNQQDVLQEMSSLNRLFSIPVPSFLYRIFGWIVAKRIYKRLSEINSKLIRCVFAVDQKLVPANKEKLEGIRDLIKDLRELQDTTPVFLKENSKISSVLEENVALGYLIEKKIRISLNSKKKSGTSGFTRAFIGESQKTVASKLHDHQST